MGRVALNTDSKFLSLFKILVAQEKYDEAKILQGSNISKMQLSNVKAHLYNQILISLRLNPSKRSIPQQIREQLDFAIILYRKGLYQQSLKILDKTKEVALHYEEKNIGYEILDLEKIIESQYITRSRSNRAELLIAQTDELTFLNGVTSRLSNDIFVTNYQKVSSYKQDSMKNRSSEVACENVHSAIQDTLYVVNGKWKLVILSILVNNGMRRFGELSRESGISPRILSKELHELEMNQLVSRTVRNTKPVTVEYASTAYAGTLKELIDAMIRWGENHRKKITGK